MILSQRLSRICQEVLDMNDYVHVDFLSKKLGISTRTVQRELKNLESLLKPFHCTLQTKAKYGVKIVGSDINKQALLTELNTQVVDYVNKEERRNLLIFELLQSSKIEKLIHYATMFKVSEATISHDLEIIDTWFHDANLEIMRKPGVGVVVVGEESNVRAALTSIINKNIMENPKFSKINFYDSDLVLEEIFSNNQGIMKLMDQNILRRVVELLGNNLHELRLDNYAQSSYMGLIIHITIAISRMLMDESLAEHDGIRELIVDDSCFKKARKIALLLEEEFDCVLPEVEIAFISFHLQCAKKMVSAMIHSEEDVHQELINDMIDGFNDDIKDVLKNDFVFMNGLLSHLKPTIVRLQNNCPIINPLLTELKQQYVMVFGLAKQAAMVLSEHLQLDINEDEIGYIAMHIGAALERHNQEVSMNILIKIGIVCASGIGVSALLEARLKKVLDKHVRCIPLSAERIDYHELDLIVTTFNLEHPTIPILVVSPLLTTKNVSDIQATIKQLRYKYVDVKSETKKIDCGSTLENMKEFCHRAMNLLQNIHCVTMPSTSSLVELLNGACDKINGHRGHLVDSLMKRHYSSSTLFPDFGFGLFHSVCEVDDFSIVFVFNEEDCFSHEECLNVKFICVICVPYVADESEKLCLSYMNGQLVIDDELIDVILTKDINHIRDEYEKGFLKAIIGKFTDDE